MAGWPPDEDLSISLEEGLGDLEFLITTDSKEAQEYFNQGFRFLASFDFTRAILSFRKALSLDSDCAICLWGEAFSLGPNINTGDDAFLLQSVPVAYERAMKAKEIVDNGVSISSLEKDLISALTVRYCPDIFDYGEQRSALDHQFALEMDLVAEKYPSNDNVLSISANAWMNTRPWDYWLSDTEFYDEGKRAKDLLERALASNPDNPYAIHLYIHVTEGSGLFALAVPYADRLPDLQPNLPHQQHMPSHTYLRTGDWKRSAEVNAIAASLENQIYPYHNMETLIWSLRMLGMSSQAIDAASRLLEMATQGEQMTRRQERAAPFLVMTQALFSKYDDVLQSPVPPSTAHYWRLLWHYCRGLAWLSAEYQNLEKAMEDYFALKEEYDIIEDIMDEGPDYEGFPFLDVGKIARLILESNLASVCDESELEIDFLRSAWQTEKNLPYDEPRIWPLPVAHSLGAALLKNGKNEEAQHVFEEVMNMIPNDGWALYGQITLVCGDSRKEPLQQLELNENCNNAVAQFKEAWKHADVDLFDSVRVLVGTLDEQITIELEDAPQCDSIKLLLKGQSLSSNEIEKALLVGTSPFPFLFSTGIVFLIIILIKHFQLRTQRYSKIGNDNTMRIVYTNRM